MKKRIGIVVVIVFLFTVGGVVVFGSRPVHPVAFFFAKKRVEMVRENSVPTSVSGGQNDVRGIDPNRVPVFQNSEKKSAFERLPPLLAQAGKAGRGVTEFFDKEERREPWATEMENALKERHSRENFKRAGLAETKISSVECRSSGCRIRYAFGKADLDTARSLKTASPLHLAMRVLGPVSSAEFIEELIPGDLEEPFAYGVKVLDDGTYSTSILHLFDELDQDLEMYAHRMERHRKVAKENTAKGGYLRALPTENE